MNFFILYFKYIPCCTYLHTYMLLCQLPCWWVFYTFYLDCSSTPKKWMELTCSLCVLCRIVYQALDSYILQIGNGNSPWRPWIPKRRSCPLSLREKVEVQG